MRDIKFRVWDKENKVFIWDIRLNFVKDASTILIWTKTSQGFDRGFVAGESAELMQYTGLKSKSGVEIFEGDILKVEEFEEQIFEVRWGGVGWVLFSKLFKKFGLPDGDTCSEYNTKGYTNKSEIIGNIWQNPDLLSSSTKQRISDMKKATIKKWKIVDILKSR